MTDTLNGYSIGEAVEIRCREFDDDGNGWHVGTIRRFDRGDGGLPYAVNSTENNDGSGWDWIRPADIRKLTQAAPARYEQRRVFTGTPFSGRTTEWEPFTLPADGQCVNVTVPGNVSASRLEIRKVAEHTDAEILAEIRRIAAAGYGIGSLRAALNGEF